MKQVKQSETRVIKRSEINIHPRNPKRHTEKQIKMQLKNIRQNGILGGLVYNERSHCMIAGNRRIMALDLYHKYDGTPETDYDVKVEVVDFDEKTELEQLTFMSGVSDTKADFNLIAEYVDTIDYENVGISPEEYNEILKLKPSDAIENIESWEDEFIQPVHEIHVEEKTSEEIVKEHAEKPKMTKEQVKAEKRFCDDVAASHHEDIDTYIVLNFRDVEQKAIFCELLGVTLTSNMMLNADLIDKLLGEINE